MLPGFSEHHADLRDVRMHYVTAGSDTAPEVPVVLLHGWPQTWYCWRKVAPLLAGRRLVMPDLRGLGDSSRPDTGYDKATLAADVAELLTSALRLDEMVVVGHDWGGVVAFFLAAQQRDRVRGLAVLDVTIPLPPEIGPDFSQGGRRWHHAFHQTEGLPEALIVGREREYYGWFYRTLGHTPGWLRPADVDEYLRTGEPPTFRTPDPIRSARNGGMINAGTAQKIQS